MLIRLPTGTVAAVSPNPTLSALVRKLEAIARLSGEEREALETLPLTIRALQPGQDVSREGDRPDYCVVVLEGWIFRYKLLGAGKRQIFSFHVPGDMPDLQSLHLPVMDHSLATLTDAKVAFIPHGSVKDLTRRFPGVSAALWRETHVDAAIFREWLVGLGRRSAVQRIAHLFCELYLKLESTGLAKDLRCPLPLTQLDIADALGLSVVHVNRSLQELRSSGLIVFAGKTLTIKDWPQLASLSEFDPLYLHLNTRQNVA